MHVEHFGLTGRPFQLTPDPRFYFESATHRKAMAYLGYGLAQGEGFIIITGDIGAGKTTLVGHLMATIDAQRLIAVKIAASDMNGDTALRLAAHAFGIATEGIEKAHVLSRLEAFMHHQARAGRRCLLIVDEAQGLTLDALEALRVMSNIQLGGQPLVQIFLLGQPEFRDFLTNSSELEQLRQRVIATHHLEPMQPSEVRPYIEHRLKIVGWTGNPNFADDAVDRLAQVSAGVPRLLNTLVQNALNMAAKQGVSIVDLAMVEAVSAEREAMRQQIETQTAMSAARSDMLSDVGHASNAQREAIRAEVSSLKAAIDQYCHSGEDSVCGEDLSGLEDGARLAKLEERLTLIETRLSEQDELLSTILTKMLEWIEQEEAAAAQPIRAA